jgi:transposase InsO family protein
VLRRPVESGQYTSTRFVGNLRLDGIDASIGTVGNALDNALMESTIGLYKTELIKRHGPWRTLADVELGTAHPGASLSPAATSLDVDIAVCRRLSSAPVSRPR